MSDFYEIINSSAKYTTIRGGRGNGITNSLLKIAYEQGRADQKEEDNAFFNFEGAWELEKKKVRADAIDDVLFILYDKGYINSDDEEYIKKQLKEQI